MDIEVEMTHISYSSDDHFNISLTLILSETVIIKGVPSKRTFFSKRYGFSYIPSTGYDAAKVALLITNMQFAINKYKAEVAVKDDETALYNEVAAVLAGLSY